MTPRTCPICGSEFTPLTTSHKYCSRACVATVKTIKNKAAKERQENGTAVPLKTLRACTVCGQLFEPRGWSQNICLSLACVRERNRLAKIRERTVTAEATCAVCGQLFIRTPSSTRSTCSRACRDELSSQTQRGATRVSPELLQKKGGFTVPTDTFCPEFPSWDCAAMDPLTNRMEPGVWIDVPHAAALRRTAA